MVKVFYFDEKQLNRALEEYLDFLRKIEDIKEVIIFGSYIRGDYVPASDIDILIILKKSDKKFLDRIPDFLPSNFPIPVNVFPYTEDEIKRMLKSENFFIKKVLKEGKSVYKNRETILGSRS